MACTKKYQPTEFMLPTSHYDKERADHAVNFIQSLKHTKGVWAGQPFLLFDWQEKIIRDLFGTIKANGYRQFNTAFVEICKKAGKSELAAAVALYMLAGDGEDGASAVLVQPDGKILVPVIIANTEREFEIVPTTKEHQEKPVKSKYHCFPSK